MKHPQTFTVTTDTNTAYQAILQQELKSLKHWRKPAIAGIDPEGIHQVRVSLRRMRTAIKLFQPLHNDRYTRRLLKKLKHYAGTFDSARDLDVLLLTLFTGQSDSSQLKSRLISQQLTAHKTAASMLKSPPFNAMRRRLKKKLKQRKWLQTQPTQPLGEFADQTLKNLYADSRRLAETVDISNDEALHRFRISCKRLRYGCEFFFSLYPDEMVSPFIDQLKLLQDLLGDIHDCFVQQQLLQQHQNSADKETHLLLTRITRRSQQLKKQLTEAVADFLNISGLWMNRPT